MSKMIAISIDKLTWGQYNDLSHWLAETYGSATIATWYIDNQPHGICDLVCKKEIATMVMLRWT